ncbi:MAG TPA: oligosaccharide flippase family protein [Candidatus Acidoferrales bacterium]|nr:oligosaccharide flippase family protein [Candidatus Acidoferrales bacterium]
MPEKNDEVTRIGARTASVASSILLGRSFALVLSGVTFIIVARLLGPTTYGIYTLAIAIAGFFGSVGDFGIGTAFNKFISEYLAKGQRGKIADVLYNGMALALAVGIILTLATIALSGVLAREVLHNAADTYVLYVASFSILAGILYSTTYNALVGFSRGRHITYVTIVQTVLQSVFTLALILAGFGVVSPIVGIIAGFIAGAIAALYIIYSRNGTALGRLSISKMRELLSFSIPMAISNVLNFVATNLTLIVLGLFAAVAIVGNFGVAIRTSSILNLVIDSIGVSMLPLFSSTMSSKKISTGITKIFNYSIYVAFMIASPIMFSLAILSKQFTYTVFSGVYSYAPLYVSVMAIGVLLAIIGAYTSTLLVSAGKVRKILKYNAIVAIIQFSSIALLIPVLKGVGAVVLLFVITPIATSAIFAYGARVNLGIFQKMGRIYRTLLSAAISAAFLLPLIYLIGQNYILLLLVSGIEQMLLYPAILAKLNGIKHKDIEILKGFTATIPMVNFTVNIFAKYTMLFVN